MCFNNPKQQLTKGMFLDIIKTRGEKNETL